METTTFSLKRKVLWYGLRILGKPTVSLRMTVSIYVASFLVTIFGFNLIYYYYYNDRDTSLMLRLGNLEEKTQHYLSNPSQYNLIFLGDSRTYCAIQPELVDAGLGTRSYNLSRFSHWFPTQYAQIMDIIDAIPQDTTVVWSVGHQNFHAANAVHRVYPIRIGYLDDYFSMGFDIVEFLDNVTYYNPFTHFIARRDRLREIVMKKWNKALPLWKRDQVSASGSMTSRDHELLRTEIARLRTKYKTNETSYVNARVEMEKVTSVELYKKGGSYHRIELDREFFRMKQQEMLTKLGGALSGRNLEKALSAVKGEEPYLKLFERILGAFQQRGVDLVVNEFQEAPFMYRSPINRDAWSRFMQKHVGSLVEQYGFHYISVDFETLKDWHYFDYNHLNGRGIQVYTPMLVEQLEKLRPRNELY